MGAERPQFRRPGGRPAPVGRRVVAMAGVLLLSAGLLLWRNHQLQALPPPAEVVVEVRGDVSQPGLVSIPAPARAQAAITAAGGDPQGMVDATVEPGTRLVVEGGAWRAEPMDQLLVVGLPVDVNTASQAALEAIPGLGPHRAAAIVAERGQGGPFSSVDDLVRVKGIGPSTVQDLRPFVVAGP